jgi:hypothetical protein
MALPETGTIPGAAAGAREHLPEYNSWNKAVRRCHVPSDANYLYYGGRGIRMCDRWRSSFLAFVADMGQRPEGAQLDRINNDLGYEPDNCRWTSPKGNTNNRRTTAFVEWQGRTVAIGDLAAEHGLKRDVLNSRLRLGWTVERAVTTPVGPHGGDYRLPAPERAHCQSRRSA